MGEKRRRWTGAEIVAVLRRHLVDKVELSTVCEETGCCPSQFYRWQKMFFDGGAAVFDRKPPEAKVDRDAERRAAELDAQLRRKDAVLAKLMEEHVLLKKVTGAPSGADGSRTTRGTK